jgi:ribosomal protein S18 acetylase RimI-like enzyme
MDIRKARREDYDDIVMVWSRAGLHHQPDGRDSRKELEREMEDPEADVLVAIWRGRMIGTIIGTNDGRKGWVNRLAVDLEFRGKGVAKALVDRVEVHFKARSIKIFCCLIDAENEPSQSLFEQAGYDRRSEVVYYSKKLDPEI